MPVTLPHTFGTALPQPPEPMSFLDDNFTALLNPLNGIIAGTTATGSALVPTVNAQTGTSYTFQASDLGKLVTFTNAAAIAATLPQGTGSFAAPFMFYVRCLPGSTGSATITPTTSTIDGASSLVLAPGIGAMVVTDAGGNYQIERYAAKGALSAGTTLALNPWALSSTTSIAHGLAATPTRIDVYLQCKIAEHGYNVNDVVYPGEIFTAGVGSVWTVSADATNVYIATNTTSNPLLTDRSTNANFSLTTANWQLVVKPYAFI